MHGKADVWSLPVADLVQAASLMQRWQTWQQPTLCGKADVCVCFLLIAVQCRLQA
jgi:hypothetical protein